MTVYSHTGWDWKPLWQSERETSGCLKGREVFKLYMGEKIQSTCVAAEERPGIHPHSFSAAYSGISASSYLSIQCFSTMWIRQTRYSSTRVKTALLYKSHLKNINDRTLRSIGKWPRTVVPSQRARVSRALWKQTSGAGSGWNVWASAQCKQYGLMCRRQAGDSKKPRFAYSDPNLPPRRPSAVKPPHRLHPPSGSEAQMPCCWFLCASLTVVFVFMKQSSRNCSFRPWRLLSRWELLKWRVSEGTWMCLCA